MRYECKSAERKIAQLHLIVPLYKYIVRFEVAMHESESVAVFKALEELVHNAADAIKRQACESAFDATSKRRLCRFAILLDVFFEVHFAVLEAQMHDSLLYLCVDYTGNVRMIERPQMRQLTKNARRQSVILSRVGDIEVDSPDGAVLLRYSIDSLKELSLGASLD